MLFKLLGCGLLLSAGAFTAYRGVRAEKKRLDVVEAWIDLISELQSQISCYLRPIDEILGEIDKTIKKRLGAPQALTPIELLHASMPSLDRESARYLSTFVREVGGSYREEQLKKCDFCLSALQRQREKQAHELPSRQKLTFTLSILAPLGVAILLW